MKYKTRFLLIINAAFVLFWTVCSSPVCASNGIENIGPKTEQVNKGRYGHIYYVSVKSGSDKKGDGTRSKPWKTLVFAMQQIREGSESSPGAVFTAAGCYDQGTIMMVSFIDLYGGFEDQNWQRNIDDYKTVLDNNANTYYNQVGADCSITIDFGEKQ